MSNINGNRPGPAFHGRNPRAIWWRASQGSIIVRVARHPGLANGPARIHLLRDGSPPVRCPNDKIAQSSFGADASREDKRGQLSEVGDPPHWRNPADAPGARLAGPNHFDARWFVASASARPASS